MKLKRMPKDTILEVIDEFQENKQFYVIVFLTNGQTLCGNINSFIPEDIRNLNPAPPNTLELYYKGTPSEYYIFVSIKKIAGITPLFYYQNKIETDTPKPIGEFFKGPAYKTMFYDSVKKAKDLEFEIRHIKVSYHPMNIKPFKWGKIKFTDDTPLYCDWNYLIRINGGLNSVGVGFVVNFSAGWSKSLWSSFLDKVTKTEVSLKKVHNHSKATLSGYVSFLIQDLDNKKEELEMEGTKWLGTFITNDMIKKREQLKETSYVICYFREDSFMFPKDNWENFSQPIKIFGEVVNAPFHTEFGEAKCFVKARAAAYIS